MRAVIDTNVVFEGLTKHGVCGQIMDAWVARRFTPCASAALALEYEEVLGSKLASRREQALLALQALLDRAEYVPIYFLTRPLSPDADDDFLIECAFNASALLVTRNRRDLIVARDVLGISVLNPEAFLLALG